MIGMSRWPASDQRLQRGEDLLVGQIAGRTEEDEGIRAFKHGHLTPLGIFDKRYVEKRGTLT